MSLGTDATLSVGSPTAVWGLIIQDFRSGLRGKTVPLGYQESVSCDTKRGMMMKTAPAPAFIVTQAQFLLQFLIVTLHDPAMFQRPIPMTMATVIEPIPSFVWRAGLLAGCDYTPNREAGGL